MLRKKELKLNIGCGTNRLRGYVNIDAEKDCEPDIVMNVAKRNLPYDNETVDEIIFFHTIEHIEKIMHRHILGEFSRVLKYEARLYISYPNFWECAKNWHINKGGQKKFWEATLYGRQLYDTDYHVCAMDPDELTSLLYECGFKDIEHTPEVREPYNTVTIAVKDLRPVPTYETVVATDMNNMRVVK